MKKLLPLIFITILLTSCTEYHIIKPPFDHNTYYYYDYHADLSDWKEHLFKVELNIDSLQKNNDEFIFVTSVPGSYTLLDIGRYVKSFSAYDGSGNELGTKKISVNKYQLLNPQKTRTIKYSVMETFKNELDSNKVPDMSGSSIDSDHVFLNTFCVFGYIKDLRDKPYRIELNYPQYWTVGTSLLKNYGNYYYTSSFRELTDSPFLLGNLTKKEFHINCRQDRMLKPDYMDVSIYTWSQTGKLKSSDFEGLLEDVVNAEVKFMDRKPVDDYTFLFLFGDESAGAHEHKHSSTYVLKEKDYSDVKSTVRRITAHEFYHIQTPLTLSEEKLKDFDFEYPVPTEHLWFYEGLTEWAANILLLRAGLTDEKEFFTNLCQKMDYMEDFDKNLSLTDLSLNSYSKPDQYANIYEKGAVTATILDLLIIEKTDGAKGLKEVVNAMTKAYGDKPIDSDKFFQEVVKYSNPSVSSFITDYIKNAEPIYLRDYLEPLGIKYFPFARFETNKKLSSDLGFMLWPDDKSNTILIKWPDSRAIEMGFRHNDTLVTINDRKMRASNIQPVLTSLKIRTDNIDIPYTAVVRRGGQDFEIKAKTMDYWKRHMFEFMIPNDHSKWLMEKWLKQ